VSGDGWPADDKWMSQMPDFGFPSSIGDFGNPNFTTMPMDEDIINYGDFLNDNDGLNGIDLSMWGEDLGGTEA